MLLLILQIILEFFIESQLEFKVDDFTTSDPNATRVIWHLCTNAQPL